MHARSFRVLIFDSISAPNVCSTTASCPTRRQAVFMPSWLPLILSVKTHLFSSSIRSLGDVDPRETTPTSFANSESLLSPLEGTDHLPDSPCSCVPQARIAIWQSLSDALRTRRQQRHARRGAPRTFCEHHPSAGQHLATPVSPCDLRDVWSLLGVGAQ